VSEINNPQMAIFCSCMGVCQSINVLCCVLQCLGWVTRLPKIWTVCCLSWTWWSIALTRSRSSASTERWVHTHNVH